MRTPSLSETERAYKMLRASEVRGVPGVIEFRSRRPGPRVYAGVCTHGDERMGAAIAVPFLRKEVALTRGSVVMVVNNIVAADLNMRAIPDDPFGNFNRMDPGVLDYDARNVTLASVYRMRALHAAGLFDAEFGFDTHTMRVCAGPVKISIKGDPARARQIPFRDSIVGIIPHQHDRLGNPTVAFGNFIGGLETNNDVIEVEGGGPHTDPAVIQGLVSGFEVFLASLGMVDFDAMEVNLIQDTYTVTGATWMPASGYRLVKPLMFYELVREGEILAVANGSDGPPIVAQRDSHVLFPPRFGEDIRYREAAFFNAERTVETVRCFVPKE